MWEMLARPNLEQAAEVWLRGEQTAHKKLESVQMRASNTSGRSSSAGGHGVEEIGREEGEKTVLYCRRLAKLNEGRLVTVVADELRMDGR